MNNIDPQFLTIATAIVGVFSSIITQTAKRYIPDAWRGLFALGVSIVVSVVSILIVALATVLSGQTLTLDAATLTTAVFGVIGVAQTIYAAVHKLVSDHTANTVVDKPNNQ